MAVRIKRKPKRPRGRASRIRRAQAEFKKKGLWLAEFSAEAAIDAVLLPGNGWMILRPCARPVGFESFSSVMFCIANQVGYQAMQACILRYGGWGIRELQGVLEMLLRQQTQESQGVVNGIDFPPMPTITMPLAYLHHEDEDDSAVFISVGLCELATADSLVGKYLRDMPEGVSIAMDLDLPWQSTRSPRHEH